MVKVLVKKFVEVMNHGKLVFDDGMMMTLSKLLEHFILLHRWSMRRTT